ncbi:MAG: hypothetical protein LBG90_04350 [Spirochaetaceae bacterium]|jgi:hypothetical protein|nr:hypothetical protein [Spirochaetaceae bacterium]
MPPIFAKISPIIAAISSSLRETLKKQAHLLKLCGFMALLLLAVILFLPGLVQDFIDKNPELSTDYSRKLDNTPITLPVEELFLPDEPDFLPEVLLEQEPRSQWTPEDARPFWQNPENEDPEQWQKQIKTVIDELLKGVP